LSAVRRHRLSNGEPVPTLAEALAVLPGLDVWVEVKALDTSQDAAVLRVLAEGPEPGRYRVHSFDHRIVARLAKLQPGLEIGVLSASYPLDPIRAAVDAGARTLWQEWPLIDAALMAAATGAGIGVIAWTVPAEQAHALAALGVSGLCGNHPDALRAALTLKEQS
jgi:glycerophosphoryl diester phosphodiesterase